MFKTTCAILSKCNKSYISGRTFSLQNKDLKNKLYTTVAVIGLTSLLVLTNRKKSQLKTDNISLEDGKHDEIIRQKDIQQNIESILCKADSDNGRNKYNFIDKVVKRCSPAVFHILISSNKGHDQTSSPADASPFVYGSGFVIREDGWAITNAHVVLNKDSIITCRMSDGTVYGAEVVDMDVNVDVALLKLRTDRELTPLPFEKPGVVNIGEWVIALGSPLSLANSISVGVVSSINRSARELGLKNYSMSYIQTDALITFGNSGGPLVNLDGKVIGISSLRLTSGISFAIPVEYCLKFLEKCQSFNPHAKELLPTGDEMTFFGITTIALNPNLVIDLLRKQINVPEGFNEGLLVWKVLEESVAKKCGIRAGDIITHINGVPITNANEMYKISKNIPLEFVIIDGKTQKELTILVPAK